MIRRIKGFLLVLFSLSSIHCFAQQDSLQPKPTFNWDYIHSGFMDAKDQILAPAHWNGEQWMTVSALASVEAVLIFGDGDKNIQLFAQKYRNSTTNFLENNFGDPFGDGLYPAIIVGSAYLAGCVFHKDKLKKFAMLTTKSVILSGLTTTVIKYIAERHRPYQDNPANPLDWNGPMGNTNTVSFPSGHTTVAFATATMIACEFPKPAIVPVLAYSLATVTALGRINGNYHWGSDVLMGASIGYFTSKLVFNHNNWGKLQRRKKIPQQ